MTYEQHQAPRVTPADVDNDIICQYVFTAKEATDGGSAPQHESLGLLTIAVLVLQNGFTVVGKSACASPENFDPEIGARLAIADAQRQVWPLLGYELRTKLHTTLPIEPEALHPWTRRRP